jgi:NADH-quinone oxidoreductase subunit C
MRDDIRNTTRRLDPAQQRQTLKFLFTPRSGPTEEARRENPHAKGTTFLPELVEALQSRFGEAITDVVLYANEHTVFVTRESLVDVCRYLKEEAGFGYFVDMGGIDRFTEERRFEVYYGLVNMQERRRIRIKVRVEEEDAVLPTLTGLYRAANWNERECFDMFGIRFDGHPDPRRMYLPEDFEYFPLRKEFPVLGIPGSLPLPPQSNDGELTPDPYPRAHGRIPTD